MRKLVFILIAFIAVVTFIRAYDNAGNGASKFSAVDAAEFPAHINEGDLSFEAAQ
jgi:hypothetical protein